MSFKTCMYTMYTIHEYKWQCIIIYLIYHHIYHCLTVSLSNYLLDFVFRLTPICNLHLFTLCCIKSRFWYKKPNSSNWFETRFCKSSTNICWILSNLTLPRNWFVKSLTTAVKSEGNIIALYNANLMLTDNSRAGYLVLS